tara:strand:- start:1258 stop:1449 length:192 start_codon:yes stop_codon:yes gene_type:complete
MTDSRREARKLVLSVIGALFADKHFLSAFVMALFFPRFRSLAEAALAKKAEARTPSPFVYMMR